MSMRQCDNASVGVLAERAGAGRQPRWLLIWRNTFPFSVAPVSGHVFDGHGGYRDAAFAEMKEEAGLTVERLSPTGVGGWRPNRCRRKPGALGTGHLWNVYTATVSGEVKPSGREVKEARWLSRPEVQLLANRTVLYARGRISDHDMTEYPGIEPVWTEFLTSLDVISVAAADLELIAEVMAEGRARVLWPARSTSTWSSTPVFPLGHSRSSTSSSITWSCTPTRAAGSCGGAVTAARRCGRLFS